MSLLVRLIYPIHWEGQNEDAEGWHKSREYEANRRQARLDEPEWEVGGDVESVVEPNDVDASCWDLEQRPEREATDNHPGEEVVEDRMVAVGVEEGTKAAGDRQGGVDGMQVECACVVLS